MRRTRNAPPYASNESVDNTSYESSNRAGNDTSSNPVVRIDACRLGGGDDDGELGCFDAKHPMNAAIKCETTVGELREFPFECARERRHRAL